jgi:hypothetical protein
MISRAKIVQPDWQLIGFDGERIKKSKFAIAATIDHLVKKGFPLWITGNRVEIIYRKHVAVAVTVKLRGGTVLQLGGIVNL